MSSSRAKDLTKKTKFAYVVVVVVRTDLALPAGYTSTYIEQRCNVIRVASVEGSFPSV